MNISYAYSTGVWHINSYSLLVSAGEELSHFAELLIVKISPA